MTKRFLKSIAAAAVVAFALVPGVARADVYNVTVTPGMVPDEQTPRIGADAPVGWGEDSWKNSATGKVNMHIDTGILFQKEITISDIASIKYWTKAPTGTENWYLNIYTELGAGTNDASWYGQRFFNSDYTGYTSDGLWHEQTLAKITKSSGTQQVFNDLAAWQAAYGNNTIKWISAQTNSGISLSNREGQIDGLTITLTQSAGGHIGNVDFAAVTPTPVAATAGLVLMGLTALKRRRAC